jgi:hypothetical protein
MIGFEFFISLLEWQKILTNTLLLDINLILACYKCTVQTNQTNHAAIASELAINSPKLRLRELERGHN